MDEKKVNETTNNIEPSSPPGDESVASDNPKLSDSNQAESNIDPQSDECNIEQTKDVPIAVDLPGSDKKNVKDFENDVEKIAEANPASLETDDDMPVDEVEEEEVDLSDLEEETLIEDTPSKEEINTSENDTDVQTIDETETDDNEKTFDTAKDRAAEKDEIDLSDLEEENGLEDETSSEKTSANVDATLEKEQQDSEADEDITDNSEYEDDGLFNIPEPEYDQEEEGLSDKDDICVGDDMPNDGLSQEDVTGIENDPRFEKTVDLSDFDIQSLVQDDVRRTTEMSEPKTSRETKGSDEKDQLDRDLDELDKLLEDLDAEKGKEKPIKESSEEEYYSDKKSKRHDDVANKKTENRKKKKLWTILGGATAVVVAFLALLLYPAKITATLTAENCYQYDSLTTSDFSVETRSILGVAHKKANFKVEDGRLTQTNNVVKISCDGKEADVDVTAVGLKKLDAKYSKESAYESDPIRTSDIKVVAEFADGTTRDVDDVTFANNDVQYITSENVVLHSKTYGDITCKLPYVAVKSVKIQNHDTFYVNEKPEFDAFTFTYADGTEKVIKTTDTKLGESFGKIPAAEGSMFYTFDYHGRTYEISQNIATRTIKSASANVSEGYVDEAPNITSINITFDDGSTKTVDVNDEGLSKAPDTTHKLAAGDNEYEFVYNGAAGSFNIRGNRYPATSIVYKPDQTLYAGEPLTDGAITITYSNGQTENINSRNVEFTTNVSSLKEGDNSVQFRYEGQVYTMTVKAEHVYIINTTIAGDFKVGDMVGEADLTITYNTGNSVIANTQAIEFTDRVLESGENTFIYTFNGQQGTFTIDMQ
ncbi:hypothetical protein IMM1_36060 [Pseudocoprococcus immobilis]